jgi:hypothetical protein
MKKSLIKIGLIVGLGSSLLGNDLSLSKIDYIFDHKLQKCRKAEFKEKQTVKVLLEKGEGIVDKQLDTVAGVYTPILIHVKGEEYFLDFFSTYGTCKMYHDVIIKNDKSKKPEEYIGLGEV